MMSRNYRESSEVSWLLKTTVFVINVIFWLTGLLFTGVGVWAFVEKNRLAVGGDVDSLQDKYGDVFDIIFDLTILVFLVGISIFLLAFIGCLGALRENICLLKTFTFILGALFLTEVVVAILAFVFSNTVKNKVIKIFQMEALVHYRDDDDLRNLIDWTQVTFRCCGVGQHGYKDWSYNQYFNCTDENPSLERCSVPYSCCVTPNDVQSDYINTMCGYQAQQMSSSALRGKIFTEGCVQRILWLAQKNLFLVGGVALGMAILQIFGIFLAQLLASQVTAQKQRWV